MQAVNPITRYSNTNLTRNAVRMILTFLLQAGTLDRKEEREEGIEESEGLERWVKREKDELTQ